MVTAEIESEKDIEKVMERHKECELYETRTHFCQPVVNTEMLSILDKLDEISRECRLIVADNNIWYFLFYSRPEGMIYDPFGRTPIRFCKMRINEDDILEIKPVKGYARAIKALNQRGKAAELETETRTIQLY